jgi:hypothetical protein
MICTVPPASFDVNIFRRVTSGPAKLRERAVHMVAKRPSNEDLRPTWKIEYISRSAVATTALPALRPAVARHVDPRLLRCRARSPMSVAGAFTAATVGRFRSWSCG